MRKKQRRLLLLTALIVFLSVLYALFILESNNSLPLYARNGLLDMQNTDLTDNRIVELNGEWSFYPHLLKEELASATPSVIKEVPHFWEGDDRMNRSPYGVATYTLKLTGLQPKQLYGVECVNQASAYGLYVDGRTILSNGTVSREQGGHVPRFQSTAGILQADANGEVLLVMEIQNERYFRGGFWNSVKLGATTAVLADYTKSKEREMFLAASMLAVAAFVMGLHLTCKKDKTTLYLSLFCAAMCARTFLTGQRLVVDIFPSFDWQAHVWLQFLSGYLLVPLAGLFAINLFDAKWRKQLSIVFFVVAGLCLPAVFLLPNSLYGTALQTFLWIGVVIILYFAYLVGRAIKQKQPGTVLMLYAALGMIIAVLQEIFVRGSVSWVPFGMLNFMICFSIITFEQFLEIMRRNEVLETKVILDPLTGLYNRSYLMKMSGQYTNGQNTQVECVLFMDLDGFKSINDSYGHEIGDQILQETSRRLRNLLRDTDVICRYGGDEFIAVIVTDEPDGILPIADRMIRTIGQPYHKDGASYQIGMSIGIAVSNVNAESMETLIKTSDEAMYIAKKNGGNQYHVIKLL